MKPKLFELGEPVRTADNSMFSSTGGTTKSLVFHKISHFTDDAVPSYILQSGKGRFTKKDGNDMETKTLRPREKQT